MFPRNVPDILTVDGNKIVVRPSETEDLNASVSDSFEQAEILTHCDECLKKHTLTYSDRFPSGISFRCSECDTRNKLLSTGGSFSSSDTVLRILKDKVRKRDSMIAGINYADAKPKKANQYIEKRDKFDSVVRVPIFLISMSTVFIYIMQMYVTPYLSYFETRYDILIIFCTFITSYLLASFVDVIASEIKNSIIEPPKDNHITLNTQYFVKGINDSNDICEDCTKQDSESSQERQVQYS